MAAMQAMMPSYLEASMASFRKNREQLHEAFKSGLGANPLAKIAETNFRMMQNAAEAFIPGARKPAAKRDQADELAQMREQMAAMQRKLDELSK